MSVDAARQPTQTSAAGDAARPVRRAIGHRTVIAMSAHGHLSDVRNSAGNIDLLGYSDFATTAWR